MASVNIRRIIEGMTLEQRIAQLFLSGIVAEESLEQVRAYMEENHFGGYSLSYNFARFIRGGSYHPCGIGRFVPIERTARFLHDVKELSWQIMGVPTICTCDQEGGMEESEFRRSPTVLTPNQMGLAAIGEAKEAYANAYLSASQLKAVGVDMLLGACLDVNSNPRNPEIAHRALGDEPATVARLGKQVIRAYMDAGLFCTAKHFPGRGHAEVNVHADFDVLDMPREHFEAVEFPPFRAAIRAGVEMVMLSHSIYPALGDAEFPASLSRAIIQDVLRGQLGFKGVVYTDDLSMLAISNRWGVPTACAMAFAAGNDMILMKVNKELTPAVRETVRFIREGRLSEEQVNRSVEKVLKLKRKYGMFERRPFDPRRVRRGVGTAAQVKAGRRLARKAVLCLRNVGDLLPLTADRFRSPLVVAQRSCSICVANDRNRSHDMLLNSVRRHFPGAWGTVIDQNPTADQTFELEGLAKNADVVIFMLAAVRSGEAAVGQEAPVLEALKKTLAVGKPLVAMITGAPYLAGELPDAVAAVVCCFGVSPLTIEAVVDLMCGRIPSIGRLPVHVSDALPRGFQVKLKRAQRTAARAG